MGSRNFIATTILIAILFNLNFALAEYAIDVNDLEIVPAEDFESIGPPGGPFEPADKQYQLKNIGDEAFYWGAEKSADWVVIEPDWGLLEPNQTNDVIISFTSEANSFPRGEYSDTITFKNLTTFEGETRQVILTVEFPANIWVEPNDFNESLPEGTITNNILTIGNEGFDNLSYQIQAHSVGGSTGTSTTGTLSLAQTSQDAITLEYNFGEPVITKKAEYDLLEIKGLELHHRTGAPIIPVRPVRVLIPFGKKVVDTRVTHLSERQLAGNYYLPPGQKPYALEQPGSAWKTRPDPKIYGRNNPWPGRTRKVVGTQIKRGYRVFTVNLYPLQYNPVEGSVSFASRMRLEIILADAPSSKAAKPTPATRALLNRRVDNPAVQRSYPSEQLTRQKLSAGPLLPLGGPYQYVIITDTTLKDASGPWNFQKLRDDKTAHGMPATIVTTDWIYSNYDGTRPDGGTDSQTRIRNFLIDAYQDWGTEYVLLGGTDAIVPARMFWVDSLGGDTDYMPVDMYYGCVDPPECSFDYDSDGKYGEPTDGVGGGDVDLYAEIYVGRAAVENATELENFIKKTLQYDSTVSEYLCEVTMVGEYLGFGGASEYAKNSMEQIRLGGDYDGYFTNGFENHNQLNFYDFDTSTNLYDADGTWSKSELIDLMNEGKHIFNHLGHAGYTSVMKLGTSDLSSLDNTDYFFAYSQGCKPGAFDTTDCFAEEITAMENGAFAVVMNARYGYGRFNSTDGPSQRFARQFWDSMLGEDILELGRANQDSKEDNLWDINGGCIRWCYYELNLFGDPAMQMRFEETCDWLTIEPQQGTVGPDDTNDVNVTFNALELDPGTYEAQIVISSNDPCNPTTVVPVTMTVTLDDLQVSPEDNFESEGDKGGPFPPECKTYTLTNVNSVEALAWSAEPTEDWLQIVPYEGVLDPCQSIDVNVCLTEQAELLDPNVYTETLTFINVDSNSIKQRQATVTVQPADAFTESFAAGQVDLSSISVRFLPVGSGAYYAACRTDIDDFQIDPNGGIVLSLGDDTCEQVIFGEGKEFNFYGIRYDRIFVGSNGYITFGSGDTEYFGSLDNHFSKPRISGLFTDLSPSDDISIKQLSDRFVITYLDIPLFGDKDAKSSFQIELFFADDYIRVTWLGIAETDTVVGLSEGCGYAASLFVESDLSGYLACCPCGDFTGDFSVNWSDLAVFASHWLRQDCNSPYLCEFTDLDRSRAVDFFDYSIFAQNWLIGPQGPNEPNLPDPVSHWKFDEGEGDIAYDSAGDNDGTINGAQWSEGWIDGALQFDGDNDYVSLSENAITTTEFTVSGWANHFGQGGGTYHGNRIFTQRDDESGDNRCYVGLATELDWDGADCAYASIRSSSGSIQRLTVPKKDYNEWHHYGMTVDSDEFIFYIDGIDVNSTSNDQLGDYITSIDYVDIGRYRWGGENRGFFNGQIDDVRIYDQALSGEEILQLYQEGSGPVSHWKFDEGGGDIAYDSVGDNNGTVHGAQWSEGWIDGALDFDGDADYVEVPDSPELRFDGTEPFTVSAWFQRLADMPDNETLVGKGFNGDPENLNYLLRVRKTDNTVCWFWEHSSGTNDDLSSSVVPELGQWYHAVGVWDGTEQKIYVNGVERNSTIPAGLPDSSGNRPVVIGRMFGGSSPAGQDFNGLIDDVRIYDRALSDEEILQLYQEGAGTEQNCQPW